MITQSKSSLLSSDTVRLAYLLVMMTLSIELGPDLISEATGLITTYYIELTEWLTSQYAPALTNFLK